MSTQVNPNHMTQKWEEYSRDQLKGRVLSPEALAELKKAFLSGAYTMFCIGETQARMPDAIAQRNMRNIHEELVHHVRQYKQKVLIV
jgi:hypothetical protein